MAACSLSTCGQGCALHQLPGGDIAQTANRPGVNSQTSPPTLPHHSHCCGRS
jgi:hypothetical protein